MRKFYLSILFSLTAILLSSAASLKGKITNQAGEALPYATVFIEESGSGTTTNVEGNYAIELTVGTYTIHFQYLGYQSEIRTINLSDGEVKVLDIVLSPQVLELKGIEITDGREDPAYTIMRKAIAKASYHREQIESYTAKVYTKGTGSVDAPKFVDKIAEKQGMDSIAFISESISHISYQRPNVFKEKIVSIRQQGENNGTTPSNYLKASFYHPRLGNSVSPLSPRARSYYRFEFLGSYLDNGIEVNKIKVIPKNRGEGVFEGTISIVENQWGIYSLDLTTHTSGFVLNIKQFYQLILDKAWMPTTQQFQFNINALGFGLQYNYYATTSDYNIELNPDLALKLKLIDETIMPETSTETTDKKAVKEGDLGAVLASGEELTLKDLRKTMKAYRKQERKAQKDKSLNHIEDLQIDSSAYNRDTAFWSSIRSIPLTDYEKKSYRTADSIAFAPKAEEEEIDAKSKDRFKALDLVAGGKYPIGEKTQLVYKSPLFHFNFNTIEGYHIGTDFSLKRKIGGEKELQIGYVPRYSFAQNKYRSIGYLNLDIGKTDRSGTLRIEGGNFIAQLNDNNPIHPYINAFHTLLFQENYMKILDKSYVSAHFDQQILDNLSISVRAEYASRATLQNDETVQPWIGNRAAFTSNTPFNIEIEQATFEPHELWRIDLGLEWKPWQRYNLKNGKKAFFNRGPSFIINYSKAGQDADYDFLEAGIRYTLNPWDGSQFDLNIMAGGFFNNEQVFFPDFKHFLGNQTFFMAGTDPVESFRLLPYYDFSTQDRFVEAHAQYQFRTLALTHIPFVWMLGIKENLFIGYLNTPSMEDYLEVGYGLDNIFKFFRLELVTSFHDYRYEDFGIRVGISSSLGRSLFSVKRSK